MSILVHRHESGIPLLREHPGLVREVERAEATLRKRNSESPVHQSQFGPVSEVARDALQIMRPTAQLSADILPVLSECGPYTVFAGISAVSSENRLKILEILRTARAEVIQLQKQEGNLDRVMVVQIQGYFATNPP